MGTGYTRNDTANNIADGNIINAADLDGEFDAIESAFNSSTGHTHDGTAAEGGAILVLGPSQEFVASSTEVKPSTNAGLSLGTSLLQFNDLYIDGTAYIDGLGESILVDTNAKIQFRDTALFINSSADGQLDIEADTTIELTAPTVSLTDNLKLASDAAVLSFGADDEITVTHVHNTGLDLKNATGFDLNLQTSDTTVESGNLLGKITFNAPDEASGTDAIVVGASIEALAEATFDSATNSTALVFKTNTSGAATERMRVKSDGDVVFNGASYDMTWDTSANALTFADNAKAIFGAGSDLQIYHDGSNSRIVDTGTGDLSLEGANVRFRSTNGDYYAYFTSNAETSLYYNNAVKLATTSTGVDITGTLTSDALTVETGSGGVLTLNNTTTSIGDGTLAGTLVFSTDDTSGAAADVELKSVADSFGKQTFAIRTGRGDISGPLDRLSIDFNGDISFYEDTGVTPKFFWDASAESLGIGTSSPNNLLQINGGAADTALQITNSATGSTATDGFSITVENPTPDVVLRNREAAAMRFLTSNSESMRIDSSGNVGIGTSSPDALLNLEADQNPVLRLGSSDGTVQVGDILGTIEFYSNDTNAPGVGAKIYAEQEDQIGAAEAAIVFETGVTGSLAERMRITSDGSVGIGTSSPSDNLHIASSLATIRLEDSDVAGGASYSLITSSSNGNIQFSADPDNVRSSTDIRFSIDGSEAMRITSSGLVGIGTSSPATALDVDGGANSDQATFSGTAGRGLKISTFSVGAADEGVDFNAQASGSTQALTFSTGSTERMRIYAGNLLVGKTSSATNTVGIEIDGANGVGVFTRDGNAAIEVNRKTSDGDILNFRKDGSTVGSIGARSGDLGVATGNTGIRFYDASRSILPYDPTVPNEPPNVISLGDSGSTFKDLYLSGGVYLGGTGSANHLDDYEEGTWTVYISDASSGGNIGSGTTTGYYTKIGRQVWVQAGISTSSGDLSAMTSGNTLYIQGLPFTSNSVSENRSQSIWLRGVSYGSGNVPYAYISSNTTAIYFAITANNTFTFNPIEVSSYSGGDQIYVNIMYWV